jgi:hypothetical protein
MQLELTKETLPAKVRSVAQPSFWGAESSISAMPESFDELSGALQFLLRVHVPETVLSSGMKLK